VLALGSGVPVGQGVEHAGGRRAVIRYIENRQKHHAKKSFREEYVAPLEKFGMEYDPRYIFKTGGE
jgi:hypothetical protein